MSSEGARPAPMLALKELVACYLDHAGEFAKPVALTAFDLTRAETEHLFGSFDEDYQISRFLHFTEADGMTFLINSERVTHVSIDPEIETIL